jgi:hypothetical protein
VGTAHHLVEFIVVLIKMAYTTVKKICAEKPPEPKVKKLKLRKAKTQNEGLKKVDFTKSLKENKECKSFKFMDIREALDEFEQKVKREREKSPTCYSSGGSREISR